MSQKDQHQSAAMEAWEKTRPPACQNSTCGHDTVDHPGYDQCGGKMYCVTCQRPLHGPECYFCRMQQACIGIKTEECTGVLDEVIQLLKELKYCVCKRHDGEKTPF